MVSSSPQEDWVTQKNTNKKSSKRLLEKVMRLQSQGDFYQLVYYKSVMLCMEEVPWGLWPIHYADNEAKISIPSPKASITSP